MKTLQVVRDSKGIVVATSEVGIRSDDGVQVEAVLEGGQTVELVEQVPETYLLDLPDFLKKCRRT